MLSNRLAFGNRLRQWWLGEFLVLPKEQLPPLVSFRILRPGSTDQRYRLRSSVAQNYGWRLLHCGYGEREVIADESAPDSRVVLQAEVMNSDGLYGPSPVMRYAVGSGVGMRQAYAIMQHTCGVRASALLRTHLDDASQAKLWDILNTYTHSIVELSTYPCGLGVLGWNSLFWEVRNW